MALPKRYFWMKLKESFMTSDTIDYFMSQPDGANYVVLYQMLCLKTINTDGKLSRQLGELIIPYDVEKIKRDCKWFSTDTIRVALKLYQAVGLIYEDVDGTLVLTDHTNLVGSECDSAARVRRSRANKELPKALQCNENVTPEIDIDIRDRERDRYIDIEGDKKEKRNRFTPPTLEEVQAYCQERNNGVDPQRFIDYYTSIGWMVGKNNKKMKDWKASVRTWERTEKERQPKQQGKHGADRFADMVREGVFDD